MLSLDWVVCIAIIVLSSGKFHHLICLSLCLISCSKPDAFPKHGTPPVFLYTDTHTHCIIEGWRKKLSFLIYLKSLFLEAQGEVRQHSKANILPCHWCGDCLPHLLPPSNAISLLPCSSSSTCLFAQTYLAC